MNLNVNADDPRRIGTIAGMSTYIEVLNGLHHLRSVSFSGVSLGPWSCCALAECLRHKTIMEGDDFSDVYTARLTNQKKFSSFGCPGFCLSRAASSLTPSDNSFRPRSVQKTNRMTVGYSYTACQAQSQWCWSCS